MTVLPDHRDPIRWYVYVQAHPGADFYLLVPGGHLTRAEAEARASERTTTLRGATVSHLGWRMPVLWPQARGTA